MPRSAVSSCFTCSCGMRLRRSSPRRRLTNGMALAECPQRLAPLLLRADERHPDRRMAEVRRDLHVRDGHEPDAGILDLAADEAADLLAQQLIEPGGPLAHGLRLRDAD